MQADDLLVVFADDNDTYKPMPPAEIAINRSQVALLTASVVVRNVVQTLSLCTFL